MPNDPVPIHEEKHIEEVDLPMKGQNNASQNLEGTGSTHAYKEDQELLSNIMKGLLATIEKLKVQLFLFVIGYILALAVLSVVGQSLVRELRVVITILPLLAMFFYFLIVFYRYQPRNGYLDQRPNGVYRMTDRNQYTRLRNSLNKLLDLQFEEIKRELLTPEEINALSGQDRIHFLGDIRVLGRLNELEACLRQRYPHHFESSPNQSDRPITDINGDIEGQ